MIRLSWRQFRAQAIVAAGLLVAIAVVLIATRSHLTYLYNIYAKAQAACKASRDCRDVSINLSQLDKLLELLGTALVALPALVGAFWGAPLIAREFEAGTHRLAWTQSVSRTRWLAAKLGVVGLGSVLVTGLLSLMVTWWSSPIDRAHPSRFGSGMFGERNIAPIGYAAFGFALGVAAGLLIRRTLPAMAATLFGVLAVRIAFTYAVRPKLFTPVRKAVALNPDTTGFGSNNGGPQTLFPNPPDLPNAWLYSTRVVDGVRKGAGPAGRGHDMPDAGSRRSSPDCGQRRDEDASPRRRPERAARLRAEDCRQLPRRHDVPTGEPLLAPPMVRDRRVCRRCHRTRRVLLLVDPPPRQVGRSPQVGVTPAGAGSGLIRTTLMHTQNDPSEFYVMVVFESEEHARARENDPVRQEAHEARAGDDGGDLRRRRPSSSTSPSWPTWCSRPQLFCFRPMSSRMRTRRPVRKIARR